MKTKVFPVVKSTIFFSQLGAILEYTLKKRVSVRELNLFGSGYGFTEETFVNAALNLRVLKAME